VHSAPWAPLTAFAAALLSVWWLARSRFSKQILDHPNARSLHESPVPRTGGLGLHAGVCVAMGILAPHLPLALWIAYGVLLGISFLDDARGIPAALRFAVHLLVCGLFAASVLAPAQGPLLTAGVALATAWAVNLYNFMDGADGLAGGMALFGFTAYGAAAWLAGSTEFALVNFSVAAAAAAFLVFNRPPARIFLGDAGSVPLGFLAAALGLVGWSQGDWTAWFPVLVFSPFVVDASVTLLRRALRRERVWEAHRDHYYQRLVRSGWSHRRTALAEYAMMASCAALALVGLALPAAWQIALLLAAAAAYAALMGLIDRRWRHVGPGERK
jgi:UDP-N-acetylmuramyl pentapeptide phosphotransferase/UDP-N-acetylglucosamine-1-phosphate transferase